MPSISESRKQVKESLAALGGEVDHDAILAGLQEEIDKHNGVKDDLRASMRRSRGSRRDRSVVEEGGTEGERSGMRLRFKSTQLDPRKRRKKSHHPRHTSNERRHKTPREDKDGGNYPTPESDSHPQDSSRTVHPFPRERESSPDLASHANSATGTNNTDAFRASLFDALADDEGAAAYWENIYNQPLHIYPRPATATTASATGSEGKAELEAMSDAEYVEYVKLRMWEKAHPEILAQRAQRDKERREEEEAKTRRREAFARRKERAAWERSQRWRDLDDDEGSDGDEREKKGSGKGRGYEYSFAGETNRAPSSQRIAEEVYAKAWEDYLNKWEALKRDILVHAQSNTISTLDESASSPNSTDLSARIPYLVLPNQPLTNPNIKSFIHHAPSFSGDLEDARTRLRVLKAERVRWHPDKMQQLFASVGGLDARTVERVTQVFRVVDGVVEEIRSSGSGG